jgi:predicted transcriptional regulator
VHHALLELAGFGEFGGDRAKVEVVPVTKLSSMITRLEIDTDLLEAAIALDHEATTETIVAKALREYIQRRQQLKEAVMIGAAAADRGDVMDGEATIAALQEKLDAWRNEAG